MTHLVPGCTIFVIGGSVSLTLFGRGLFIGKARNLLASAATMQDAYGKRVRKELAGVLYTDLTHYITLDPIIRLRMLKDYCTISHESPLKPSHTNDIAGWLKNGFGIHVNIKKRPYPHNNPWEQALAAPEIQALESCSTDAEFVELVKKLVSQKSICQQITMTEIIPALDQIVVQGVRNEVINSAGKSAVVIYGTESLSSAFEYESDKPFTNGKLILEALDHDKPDGKTAIEISVNGKMIFSGANSASKEKYTTLTFPIPDALVKKGRNSLGIRNLSPAAPMANWFIVSEIKITPSNSSWKTVLNYPELKIKKEKGVKAEITSIPGRFNLQMLTPGEKDYSLRAYYPLEKADPDKNYRVRFSISCSDNQTAFLAHIIRVNDWGSLGSITIPSVSDGQRYEMNFKANKEDKSPQIWFSIGKLSPGAQLTISNIIVDEQQ